MPRQWLVDRGLQFKRAQKAYPLTIATILVCVLLFIATTIESYQVVKNQGELAYRIGLTPIQRELLFDYPAALEKLSQVMKEYPIEDFEQIPNLPAKARRLYKQAEEMPYWQGVYELILNVGKTRSIDIVKVPMFEKIGQGQLWRLFTPCLLHSGLLHILFNMIWVWILSRQIEERVKWWKIILFSLIVGLASNMAQYLMSGPFFMGYSGIVAGMVGFIYVRQKIAPWEGYPLQRSLIVFIFFFILVMLIIQVFAFFVQLFSVNPFSLPIANTAHIVGGLTGMALAKTRWFAQEAA